MIRNILNVPINVMACYNDLSLTSTINLIKKETKELLKLFTNRKELIKEYNVSPKTLIKYVDSNKVWRGKYIITSNPMF